MENKKRDFFIATINREKEEKNENVNDNVEEQKKNQIDDNEYFVSPSGKHLQKTVIPAIKSNNTATKFEYLRGKVTIDVNQYSVQAKTKEKNNSINEAKEYRENTSYYGLDNDYVSNDEHYENVNDNKRLEQNVNNNNFVENQNNFNDQRNDFDEEVIIYEEPVRKEVNIPKVEPIIEKKIVTKKRRKPYKIPPLEYLQLTTGRTDEDEAWLKEKTLIINNTFEEFNFKAEVVDKIIGPTVTQFLIKLSPGVNVNAISRFESNIELNLGLDEGAKIRILNRVPNTTYMGIEVPNPKRQKVLLGDLIRCKEFNDEKGKLTIAVGLDVTGKKIYVDLTEMPHCLIAGTTQSGKSVSLNTIILSLIYRYSPDYLKLVLIDPKQVELSSYEGIPHLAMPVITDFDDFKGTLSWLVNEMERRYSELSRFQQRNIAGLNRYLKEKGQPIMPYMVVIMDEFGDWILDGGAEANAKIQKIAQKARAAGIHMILAAQRPSNDVIKGSIKANFDTKFAFKTSSFDDSKIILGGSGAEKLVGRGDLLLKYMGSDPKRVQAAFIDDDNGDISNIVRYLQDEYGTEYLIDLEDLRRESASQAESDGDDSFYDERLADVARFIVNNQVGSSQSVSISFNMGWPRTNKIFMELERLGIVGQAIKGKPREVLVGPETLERILEENKLV